MKPKIGITVGDINGIGIEVIMKTFSDNAILELCTPIIYGSSKAISYHRKALNLPNFNYNIIRQVNYLNAKTTNIINCWEEEVPINLGQPSQVAGQYAVKSLECAVNDLKSKFIDAIVTAPINKNTIQSDKFQFSGHTEFLADQFGVSELLMFFFSDDLKIGLTTIHTPLKEVASQITQGEIYHKLEIMSQSMKKDFGFDKPKIAVLGLNPHAGENGLIGKEEINEIIPAIKKANGNNMLVFGPYAADGFFGSSNFKQFDAILAMYHDQGLVPFKTISFNSGVNFTAGLPVVRTSPDHGTGYDIAGKGVADEGSFRNAVFLAIDIVKNRINYEEMTRNPLKKIELEKEMN